MYGWFRHIPVKNDIWKLGILCTALGVVGCSNKPQPPPVAYIGPTLTHIDLGFDQTIDCEPTGYVILQKEPSEGKFPGAFTVAYLEPAENLDDADDCNAWNWRLGTLKKEQATYWNALFDQISVIREVIVLDKKSVETTDADLTEITTTAGWLKGDLCLLYGPGPAEFEHAALAGVIMDTRTGTPVAYLQADAGPEDFEPPHEDRFEYDLRHKDANYLVARKFDRQVRDCTLELIARDRKFTSTQPSPWRAQSLRTQAAPVYIVPH